MGKGLTPKDWWMGTEGGVGCILKRKVGGMGGKKAKRENKARASKAGELTMDEGITKGRRSRKKK